MRVKWVVIPALIAVVSYVAGAVYAISHQSINELVVCANSKTLNVPYSEHLCRSYLYQLRGTDKDIEVLQENGGVSFLLAAAQTTAEKYRLVSFFVSRGLDINAQDIHGLSPLQVAILETSIENVTLLLSFGANPLLVGTRITDEPLAFAEKLLLEHKLGKDGGAIVALLKSAIESSFAELIPAGYIVVDTVYGDLNKDGQDDVALLIKGSDKSKYVVNANGDEVDRNRRGIVIAIKGEQGYKAVLENVNCFSSENEEGGVYFAPELAVYINKGNLYFHYAHGRYGDWRYNFRYNGADFDLIGFDRNSNRGPIVEQSVSINFLTGKMLVKNNSNEQAEAGHEVFTETWQRFVLDKPIKLSQVDDFDDLIVESLIQLIN